MRIRSVALVLVLSGCLLDGAAVVFAQSPQASAVAAGNTSRKLGSGEWEWMIYVMGDDATLNRISCVTYLLHPTFQNRSPQICQRGSLPGKGFALTARGWGTFTVGVTIDYKDKSQQRLTHDLDFQAEAEGWGAVKGATVAIPVTANRLTDGHFLFTINVTSTGKLESVDVSVTDDGSTLKTAWVFEVLIDEQPWFQIPRRSYNDKRKPIRLTASAVQATANPIKSGSALRIVGRRR
jgi:hypothetical protein